MECAGGEVIVSVLAHSQRDQDDDRDLANDAGGIEGLEQEEYCV